MKKLVLITFLILLLFSCSIPENLGIPTWTSKFQLYILNDTYEAIQLAEEDSVLVVNGDSISFYETMSETGDLVFSTNVIEDNDNISIGNIEIDDPNPIDTEIPLNEIDPTLVNGYIPAPGILPFTMPDILKDDLEPFDEFLEIQFISGQIQFSLMNNTAIWIGNVNAGEPLIIHVLDVDDNVILIHEFSEDIPPDNTITITEFESLAGVTMFNEIKVLTTGGSRGTEGEGATVDIDATLEVNIAIVNPIAQYTNAQIPEQTTSDTIYVTLDEDVTIYQATLSYDDQNITIDIANDIDLDMVATVYIEKLTLPTNAESFTYTMNIPASGGFGQTSYVTEIINIDGAILGDGITLLDSLKIIIDAITADTGDDYRKINSSDVFDIQTTIDELEFAYFQGILDPREQDEVTGDEVIDIDYPYITGEFAIAGYSEIRFVVDTSVPAMLTIDLNSINSDGDIEQLVDINGEIPILDITGGGTIVVLSSDEYNINEFISILPDSVWYTIYPIIGDSENMIEYNQGDVIETEIIIEAQLDIEADCWVIPKDGDGNPRVEKIDTEDIGQTEIDAFLNAKLTLNYINTLGFDTGVKILISQQKTDDFTELINPDTTLFTIINVPNIIQSTGPGMEQVEIEITKHDLEFFRRDSVFVIPKIQLFSEEGTPLSGSIELQALIELEIEISSGLME
ncbi:MAG: hypothetical protein P9M11_03160 [Candidatus Tenebribacter burtonii]|nr:hypothetical protein [Candidatus Tenebribacter burtonii]